MPFSIEITGTFAGVKIPAWLRVFDCRASDADAGARSPWGTSLYGSERAAVDMGLRAPGEYNDTTPISCSTYIDARTADEAEIARQLRDGLKEAAKLLAEFEAAKASSKGKPANGGSCLYRPVAFCLSNYGWCVLSDAREKVVRAFC